MTQVTLGRARRSKFEIWIEVLEACVRGVRTQSWLLRKIGLKTKVIKEVLGFLMAAGLIKQQSTSKGNGSRWEFWTTAKGEAALTYYYQLVTKFFVNPSS
ncbi:MAG: winged helix-turn-helix domain-containing protein [Candidatus Heimdallarchaeota archaeon]